MWFDATGLPWVMPSPNMPTRHRARLSRAVPRRGHQAIRGARHDAAVRDRGRAVPRWYRWAAALNEMARGCTAGRALSAAVVPADVSQVRGPSCGGVQLHVTTAPRSGRTHRHRVLHARAGWRRPTSLAHRGVRVRRRSARDRSADRQRRRARRSTRARRSAICRAFAAYERTFAERRRPALLRIRLGGDARRALRRQLQSAALAHQLAALYVLETAAVDELWFVPTSSIRSARRSRRSRTGWRCASWPPPRWGRARGDRRRARARRREPHAAHGARAAAGAPRARVRAGDRRRSGRRDRDLVRRRGAARTVPFIVVGRAGSRRALGGWRCRA